MEGGQKVETEGLAPSGSWLEIPAPHYVAPKF